jgi:two-component system nitrogen regulation response regulator NtrX
LAITAVDSTVDDVTADGRIRVDLFRRFSVNRLVVLPLRDCRSEIPMFAGLLLERACQAIGITPKTLEPAAVSILAAMPWRGNARELMSLIETLVIKVPGKVITLDALLDSARLDGTPGVNWNLGASLREARQHFEREYIAAVVAQFRGRVPDAARSLGIQRTNLYRKLRCLHIKADREGGPGGPRKGGD